MVVRQIAKCPAFYFLPKFQIIEPLKPDEKDLDEKVSCCSVNEINRAQESEERSTAGAYAIRQWLKQHRLKVALRSQKVDYCDSCKRMKTELLRLR